MERKKKQVSNRQLTLSKSTHGYDKSDKEPTDNDTNSPPQLKLENQDNEEKSRVRFGLIGVDIIGSFR